MTGISGLIVGPLWAFGFAIVIGLIDGSLNLTAGATNDLHRLQVAFDVKPRETLAGTNCVRGDVALQGQRCEQQTREANEASDLLRHVQLLYLVGIWFGIDALLRERRAKLRDGQDGSRFSAP